MACKRIDARRVGELGVDRLDTGLVAFGPLNVEAFAGEQAFVEGDELGQALERRGGLEHQCLHKAPPGREPASCGAAKPNGSKPQGCW